MYAIKLVNDEYPEKSGFFYDGYGKPSADESLIRQAEQAEYYQRFANERRWTNRYEVIDLSSNACVYSTEQK